MTARSPQNNDPKNSESSIGISKVISHLNGWNLIKDKYSDHQTDIEDVICNHGHSILIQGISTQKQKSIPDILKGGFVYGAAAYASGILLIKLIAITGFGTNYSGPAGRAALHYLFDPTIATLSLFVMAGYILNEFFLHQNRKQNYNPNDVTQTLSKRGWDFREPVRHKSRVGVRYVKSRIGLEIIPPKFDSFAESMFMNAEVSARENVIDLVVLIVPKSVNRGVDTLDFYSGVLERFSHREHLPLSIPCAIIFIGEGPAEDIECIELTSEVDRILLKRTGQYLDDIIRAKEHTNWEFKTKLNPDHGAAKLLKTAVAFANHPQGGVILIGVNDDGKVCGLPGEGAEKDELSIRKCFRENIQPKIDTSYSRNELDVDGQVLLIIDIPSAEQKPIMANERVYYRNGTESVVANASEIRKMVNMNRSDP